LHPAQLDWYRFIQKFGLRSAKYKPNNEKHDCVMAYYAETSCPVIFECVRKFLQHLTLNVLGFPLSLREFPTRPDHRLALYKDILEVQMKHTRYLRLDTVDLDIPIELEEYFRLHAKFLIKTVTLYDGISGAPYGHRLFFERNPTTITYAQNLRLAIPSQFFLGPPEDTTPSQGMHPPDSTRNQRTNSQGRGGGAVGGPGCGCSKTTAAS
jgi:hypothetical protein